MQQQYFNINPLANNQIDGLEQNKTPSKPRLNHQRLFTTCQSLLQEIITCTGYTMTKISAETNIPLITLRRLRTGITKEPRAAAFHKIFSLYCKVCLCKNVNSTD